MEAELLGKQVISRLIWEVSREYQKKELRAGRLGDDGASCPEGLSQ